MVNIPEEETKETVRGVTVEQFWRSQSRGTLNR